MNNFWQRLITGSVFVLVLSLAVLQGVVASSALFFLAALIGASEYLNILDKGKKATPSKFMTFLSVSVVQVLFFLVSAELAEEIILLGAIPVLFIQVLVELFRDKADGFSRIALAVFGTIWVGLPFALLPYIGTVSGTYTGWTVLGFFLLLWTNDTGAYLSGKSFGRRCHISTCYGLFYARHYRRINGKSLDRHSINHSCFFKCWRFGGKHVETLLWSEGFWCHSAWSWRNS
jgi:phosphatidate cytidylyltransferase